MNIIVEGVDGVGKDTFINNLSSLTGREVIRGSSFEISEGGAQEMFKKSKNILTEKDDAIINRFFYSNIVYGSIFNYPMMTKKQYKELNELVSRNAIVYYLTAETDVVMSRIEKRGDDMITKDDIKNIQDCYLEMWKDFTPKTLVVIDCNDDSLLDIKSAIYTSVLQNDLELDYIKKDFEGDKNG